MRTTVDQIGSRFHWWSIQRLSVNCSLLVMPVIATRNKPLCISASVGIIRVLDPGVILCKALSHRLSCERRCDRKKICTLSDPPALRCLCITPQGLFRAPNAADMIETEAARGRSLGSSIP